MELIMERWKDYADATIDNMERLDPKLKKKTPVEREEIRQAFYAGAACLFYIMNTDMMDETKNDHQREAVLDDIAMEIKLHMEELQAELRKLLQ